MGRPVLSRGRDAARDAGGFTLIEVMIAMAITIVVMLANLTLFNTAQRNLAHARALTEATNLASGRLADFRAMTIAQIEAAAPDLDASPNPLRVRRGSDAATADGVPFTRSWAVSDVDLAQDGAADLVGDAVKIRVEVTWELAGRQHRVAMASITTGKTE